MSFLPGKATRRPAPVAHGALPRVRRTLSRRHRHLPSCDRSSRCREPSCPQGWKRGQGLGSAQMGAGASVRNHPPLGAGPMVTTLTCRLLFVIFFGGSETTDLTSGCVQEPGFCLLCPRQREQAHGCWHPAQQSTEGYQLCPGQLPTCPFPEGGSEPEEGAAQLPRECFHQAILPDRQAANPQTQTLLGPGRDQDCPLGSQGAGNLHQEGLDVGTSWPWLCSHAEVPQCALDAVISSWWGENGHPVCRPVLTAGTSAPHAQGSGPETHNGHTVGRVGKALLCPLTRAVELEVHPSVPQTPGKQRAPPGSRQPCKVFSGGGFGA